jgi:hypothetical protein
VRTNKALVAAALAVAAASACRRAPAPAATDSAPTPSLTAPTKSVVSPLGPDATGYTNEMQADHLRSESAKLGISRLDKPADPAVENAEPAGPVTYEEGVARTREYAREFEAERHAIDKERVKVVQIPGGTPGLIPGRQEGAPIGSADDGSAPKKSDQKTQ